jgi:hypothetical protein
MELKKTFLAGKMNKDLDQRLLSGGQYSDALNITIDTSEGSNIGSVSNSLGNTLKGDITTILNSYTPAIGSTNARTIGAIEYEALNLIYWFVAADEYDAIFEYNEIDDTIAQVLICTKTGGNPSTLNFNQEYLITGVNYLPGHKDDGALLFWTDNYNPPRKINIARAKEYSVDDSRIDNDIDVIIRPPLQAPAIYPSKGVSQSNNMEERFLYFSYRYKYVDNEYSSMSPFSGVAFKPGEYQVDPFSGDNAAMVNEYNECRIVFETGNQFVQEIQLLAYDTRSLNVKIVKSIDKEEEQLNDNAVGSYTFNNNKIYAPLPADQVTRLFDNVPLLAKSQEIIGNRLIYGNYTQFQDVDEVLFSVTYSSTDTAKNTPISTFRTDRDYEVGIIYGDDYGRMTTALISNDNSVYIPPSVSDKGNSLKVRIENTAPVWATNYRLVVKQSKKDYYNIFPLWYYVDLPFRYFRINEFDRDKFKVGDYVIFKSSGTGPTYSDKEYKILEFELKPSNFIAQAEAGLYIKVKVDSATLFSEDDKFKATWTDSGTSAPEGFSILENPSQLYAEIPVMTNTNSYIDPHIPYYGSNDANSMSVEDAQFLVSGATWHSSHKDLRYTVEIDSVTATDVTFKYTKDLEEGIYVEENVSISSPHMLLLPTTTSSVEVCRITFNQNSAYSVGDKWKINCRNNYGNTIGANYFQSPPQNQAAAAAGAVPKRLTNIQNDVGDGNYGGGSVGIVNNANVNKELEIQALAKIKIHIQRDGTVDEGSVPSQSVQEFISNRKYDNIEEWFVESGAYQDFIQKNRDGLNIGSEGVCFRRARYAVSGQSGVNAQDVSLNLGRSEFVDITEYGSDYATFNTDDYPVRMIIKGFGKSKQVNFDEDLEPQRNQIRVKFQVEQLDNPVVCETDPMDQDVEIYHEITDSKDIVNNLHQVGWKYADFTHTDTVFPDITSIAGKTVLGPAYTGQVSVPNPASTDSPHNFSVGQSVYVYGGTSNVTDGYYTITYIPNQYSIVIDLSWPGSGSPDVNQRVYHQDWEADQSTTQAATIEVNQTSALNSQFNAFAFGNGVESDRIKDDFNAASMKFSPRVTSIIEDYENERKEASLTYSGVFRGDTSINRLNEFNLSLANFKDLDREFGPIQKLYARDTDVFVLHQDKINKVLYGKNVLFDAVGGGQVASIPEVLGNEMPYPVEYGISNNPESFATNAGNMYFTDSRRGCVVGIERNAVNEISSLGMTDYFRDELKDNPEMQKIGAYDPYSNRYTLSTNNTRRSSPCELTLRPSTLNVENNSGGVSMFMFNISTALSWAITLVDTGSGTSWVSLSSTSGYGAQNIYANVANNFSGSTRTVNFVVTYCTSVTQTFTLTQAKGGKGTVRPIVINKPEDKK